VASSTRKRLVVRIRWPFCGVFWLLRRRIKGFYVYSNAFYIYSQRELPRSAAFLSGRKAGIRSGFLHSIPIVMPHPILRILWSLVAPQRD